MSKVSEGGANIIKIRKANLDSKFKHWCAVKSQ